MYTVKCVYVYSVDDDDDDDDNDDDDLGAADLGFCGMQRNYPISSVSAIMKACR